MKNEVTTIGDSLKDIFVFPDPDEMHKPITNRILHERESNRYLLLGYGEKITISNIQHEIGGSACNVAVGLAKTGLKTAIFSAVGQDSEGEGIISQLKKQKVETGLIQKDKSKKTSFSIIISFEGERSILVFHSFRPEDFTLPEKIESDWIYIGPVGENYKSLYNELTSRAAQSNIKIAINPGSEQIKDGIHAFGGLLRVAKILFLNKEEAQRLADIPGVATVKEIVRVLQKTGIETIVITDGKNGAYVATESEFYKTGIYPCERVESTGAGDAFASGFLAATINGEKLFDCLRLGAVNSASVVGEIGAQKGLLSSSTIKKRIKEYRWPAESLRFS